MRYGAAIKGCEIMGRGLVAVDLRGRGGEATPAAFVTGNGVSYAE